MILFTKEVDTIKFDNNSFKKVLHHCFQGFRRTRENVEIAHTDCDKSMVTYQFECLYAKPLESLSFFLKVYYNSFSKKLTIMALQPMLEKDDPKAKAIEIAFDNLVSHLEIARVIKEQTPPEKLFTL